MVNYFRTVRIYRRAFRDSFGDYTLRIIAAELIIIRGSALPLGLNAFRGKHRSLTSLTIRGFVTRSTYRILLAKLTATR